jgi:hypothetical protein
MSPNAGGGRGLRGLSQWGQLYTWSPNKRGRYNSTFNLCSIGFGLHSDVSAKNLAPDLEIRTRSSTLVLWYIGKQLKAIRTRLLEINTLIRFRFKTVEMTWKEFHIFYYLRSGWWCTECSLFKALLTYVKEGSRKGLNSVLVFFNAGKYVKIIVLFFEMLWIRILFDLAVSDPGSYWERGSGSRSMEIDQN